MKRKQTETKMELELGAIRDAWGSPERDVRRRMAAEAQRRLAALVGLTDLGRIKAVDAAPSVDQQVVVAA
ncbi:MAG: hypothetical protein AAGJ40_07350 [Planctomycetota bacterium]